MTQSCGRKHRRNINLPSPSALLVSMHGRRARVRRQAGRTGKEEEEEVLAVVVVAMAEVGRAQEWHLGLGFQVGMFCCGRKTGHTHLQCSGSEC
jgi:hypothetical protein